MKFIRLITILLLAFYSNAIFADEYEFLWGVSANTVFDNREGDETYAPQQTIFFSRISPSFGVKFLREHKFVVGTHYIQPIGIGYKDNKFIPTAYYNFEHYQHNKSWNLYFGMIPRKYYGINIPAILFSDSMSYYNPNIRGILLQNKIRRFRHEISLDWRSLQSAEQREAFNVNYNAQMGIGKVFFVGANAQLNHLAKRKPAPEGEGVNDDMFVYPFVGLDFYENTIFDVLYLRAGYAASFDRCRAIGDWEIDNGLLAQLSMRWRKIGVTETLYVGDRQFPLYPMYGSLLNMGDPHYQSSVYAKTSIFSPIVVNRYVYFGVYLDFNTTKEGTSCYQRVVLNVNLGNVDN